MSMVFRSRRKIFKIFREGLVAPLFFFVILSKSQCGFVLKIWQWFGFQKKQAQNKKAKFNTLHLNGISIFI